jgi:hypothetical protein
MGLGAAEMVVLVVMAVGGILLMLGLPVGIVLAVRWMNRERSERGPQAPLSAQVMQLREDVRRLREEVERLKQDQMTA